MFVVERLEVVALAQLLAVQVALGGVEEARLGGVIAAIAPPKASDRRIFTSTNTSTSSSNMMRSISPNGEATLPST